MVQSREFTRARMMQSREFTRARTLQPLHWRRRALCECHASGERSIHAVLFVEVEHCDGERLRRPNLTNLYELSSSAASAGHRLVGSVRQLEVVFEKPEQADPLQEDP
jgi:hypothetical protein